jgi:DNA repair exonuclease SbcCD ATPase subunit
MAENTNDLRVTTISLDEYNRLNSELIAAREGKGSLTTTIAVLNDKIKELQIRQPEVKVVHYESHWDDYNDETILGRAKVEFVNLTEVERMVEDKAKNDVKVKLTDLENKVESLNDDLKRARETHNEFSDKLTEKEKATSKLRAAHREALEDEKETYDKNIKKLKKAVDEDVKEYKETISDLKEEIKKIKDSKTDAEVEEKRNKEIKDLKGRIKDLEKTIEELGSMNFFKRVFKLRTISAEKLVAQSELLEREKNANAVGTTWVKENNKYRKYGAFEHMWNAITVTLDNSWGAAKNAYYTVSNNVFNGTGISW